MKKFLYKTLLVLLPAAILSYPLDVFISRSLMKTHSYGGEIEVMSDLYNGNAGSDIAVYGSSRAWVHINPEILEDSLGLSAYNFGIDAHNFWLQYLRHLALLKHNEKPKQIVVAVDVFGLKKRKDLYQMEQFLPFMLWNKDIREYTSSYIGFTTLDYYIPLKRYIGQRKALKRSFAFKRNNSSSRNTRTRGFAGMNRKWTPEVEKKLKSQRQVNIVLHEESVELFARFVKECIDLDIEVIFVCTPEYIEGQKVVKNRKEIFNIYLDLAEKYDLLYLDYSDHELCYNKENFYNAGHLHKEGANTFSRILAHDLKVNSK